MTDSEQSWLVAKDKARGFGALANYSFDNARKPTDGVLRGKDGQLVQKEASDLTPDALRKLGLDERISKRYKHKRFKCRTRSKDDLAQALSNMRIKNQRAIKTGLDAYCASKADKILGIYGLRRTGKSVLMFTKALELMEAGKKVVFFDFELDKSKTFSDLMHDVLLCKERRIEFVFIDEITLLESSGQPGVPEFVERGVEIYGNLAIYGIHVILSGTDSYCLSLAKGDTLFDRMVLLHTTNIPFKEYEFLVGSTKVLDFVRVGGILPQKKMPDIDWGEFTKTSVLDNVVRSISAVHPTLGKYKFLSILDKGQIRSLVLYTMTMTNIVFLKKMYEGEYRCADLGDGKDLLAKQEPPVLFPDDFIQNVKARLRKEFNLVGVDNKTLEYIVAEMEQVLLALDVITPYWLEKTAGERGKAVQQCSRVYTLAVPGLRNYQLDKTLEIVRAEVNKSVSDKDRKALLGKITESAEGHKIEALVVSETVRFLQRDKQFKVKQYNLYGNGVDMVVENETSREASLFEVKRSNEIVYLQAKHFVKTEFLTDYARVSGFEVKSLNVVYDGADKPPIPYEHELSGDSVEVNYIKAGTFLRNIGKFL
jgi:predicted AAA+ superfamily ATPase